MVCNNTCDGDQVDGGRAPMKGSELMAAMPSPREKATARQGSWNLEAEQFPTRLQVPELC